ncbi:glycoside hydrolase family 30 beta sandwich domain-containing protein [Caldicellulosiruptoraceae bacterium PP1]
MTTTKLNYYLTSKNSNDRLTFKGSLDNKHTKNSNSTKIIVDTNKRYQEIIGFGGALTEAACYNISLLPEEKQDEIFKKYFDREHGIGYNLTRIHINSCDFSVSSYSCDDVEGDVELKHFNIDRDIKNIIPYVKKALSYNNKLHILASPWSPPAWMKTNGEMAHGGKLKEEYQKTWAEFICKFIKAYKEQGIDVWAVTVQNEPMAVQVWESCIYTAEEERDFVKNYLGPTLHENGLGDIKIYVWDHNRDLVYERAKTILSDKEAAKYVEGVAFHWYGGDHFEDLTRIKEEFPNVNLLFTEGCQEGGAKPGSWALGERYAHDIIGDLNNYTIGFIDWNIVLDMQGGPNHVGNFCDAPILVDTEAKDLFYQNAYYYLGHFSKFIEPGSVRVASNCNDDRLEIFACERNDGKRVIVILNRTEQDIDFELELDNNLFESKIPSHSIMTLISD